MNFEFSEEQNLLREQAQGFLQQNCGVDKVRAVLDSDTRFDAELYQKVADMGWTATAIPEQYGGIGLGQLELCVLAEELGKVVAPIPFSSSVYLATEALLLFGSDAQKSQHLPGIADGSTIACLAIAEGVGPALPGKLKCRVENNKLFGTKLPVADGDVAQLAIVVAEDGMYLADLTGAGVQRESIDTIDPTRSHASILFNGAECERLGEPSAAFTQLETLYDRAAILFAFEQVGGAHSALDMAKEYALGRFAFGRSIASYQAIKHKLADMYIEATLAKSNAYFGAWALSTNASELPVAAATARVSATNAYHECSKENIQTHGGMGFTWEFDCHLHYRRAKLLASNLGGLRGWKHRLVTTLEQSNLALEA